MEGYFVKHRRLCKTRNRRLVTVMALMIAVVFVLQTFILSSRTVFLPHFPSSKSYTTDEEISQNKDISSESLGVGKFSLLSGSQKVINSIKVSKEPAHGFSIKEMEGKWEIDEDSFDHFELDKDEDPDIEFPIDPGNDNIIEKIKESEVGFLLQADGDKKEHSPSVVVQTGGLGNESVNVHRTSRVDSGYNADLSVPISLTTEVISSRSVLAKLGSNASSTATLTKKKKLVIPTLSLSEMDRLLLKNRASRRSMRPRWSSAIDQQILSAKKEIEKAQILEDDQQILASLFRDISKFRRSYELMEKTLKIYIYQEGKKPIFHQPLLGSIYASEGWFMKLMESNKHYLVRDPNQAHLFYMPFSSRFLQASLYVPNSHNRTKLRQHLKNYVDMISTKYPFWNRTGGADHFLAACHDWVFSIFKD